MPKKRTRKNLRPTSTVESQSLERFLMNQAATDPRQFRDKITRANGALPGVKTNTTEWNRWSP